MWLIIIFHHFPINMAGSIVVLDPLVCFQGCHFVRPWDRGMLPCEASVESRLDPEALSKSLLPWVWILDFSSLIPKKKLKTLKTVVSFFFPGRNFDVRFFFNTVKRENIIHKRVQWFLGTASDCGYDFAVGHNYHSVVIQCHMHIIHDVPQKKMRIQKAFATSGRTHT